LNNTTKYYKVFQDNQLICLCAADGDFQDGEEISLEEYQTLSTQMDARCEERRGYQDSVSAGKIALEDVPEEYRAEVETALAYSVSTPDNPYGVSNEVYNAIVDDYTMVLMDAGVIG